MILILDHVHRLNLVALLDVLEATSRREAHAICKLQDALDLSPEERESIHLESVNANGGTAYRWDPEKTLPAKEFDLAKADIERICKSLDQARIILGRDRWFRTLNAQLPEPTQDVPPTAEPANGIPAPPQ